MQNKKYLYGQVNTPTNKINYGGSETDSLIITVDNDKMIIKGEVIWKDLLGETADKAYPGHLGSQNYNKILVLSKLLDEEISRALSKENELNSLINTNKEILTEINSTSKGKLEEEITRATTAEADLSLTIYNEIERSSSEDTKIKASITNESVIRQQEDTQLREELLTSLNELNIKLNSLSDLFANQTNETEELVKGLSNKISQSIQDSISRDVELEDKFSTSLLSVEANLLKENEILSNQISTQDAELGILKEHLYKEETRSKSQDERHDSILQAHTINIAENELKITEIANLLEDKTFQITTLETQSSDNNNLIVSLQEDLINQNSELVTLKKQLSNEEDRSKLQDAAQETILNNFNNDINQNKIKIIQLSDSLSNQSSKLDNIENQLSTQDGQITSLQSTSINQAEQLDILKNNIDQDLTDIVNRIDKAQDELQNLSTDVQYNINPSIIQIKNQISILESNNSHQEEQLHIHSDKLIQLSDDLNNLNEQHEIAHRELTNSISDIDSRTYNLTNLQEINEGRISRVETQGIQLNEEITQLSNEIELQEHSLSETSTRINKVEVTVSDLNTKSDNLNNEIEILETQISDINNSTQKELLSQKNNLNSVTLKTLNLQEELSQLKDVSNNTQDKVSILESNLEDISTESKDIINNLNKLITDEITRSLDKDTQLETSLVKNVEVLSIIIDGIQRNLYNGLAELELSDSALNEYIQKCYLELSQTDNQLRIALQDETKRAIEAEDNLNIKLENLNLSQYLKLKTTSDNNIIKVYAVIGEYQTEIEVSEFPIPNAIIRRNQIGTITLPTISNLTDASSFSNNDAIPKNYVDILVNKMAEDLRKEITEIAENTNILKDIEFIDGGTAPINK